MKFVVESISNCLTLPDLGVLRYQRTGKFAFFREKCAKNGFFGYLKIPKAGDVRQFYMKSRHLCGNNIENLALVYFFPGSAWYQLNSLGLLPLPPPLHFSILTNFCFAHSFQSNTTPQVMSTSVYYISDFLSFNNTYLCAMLDYSEAFLWLASRSFRPSEIRFDQEKNIPKLKIGQTRWSS